MTAYNSYHEGNMTDYVPTDEDLQKGFDRLPLVNIAPVLGQL